MADIDLSMLVSKPVSVRVRLVDGKERVLQASPITLNDLCDFQENLGALKEFADDVRGIRYLVWLSMRHNHPDITLEEVGALFTSETLRKMKQLVEGFFPKPAAEAQEPMTP